VITAATGRALWDAGLDPHLLVGRKLEELASASPGMARAHGQALSTGASGNYEVAYGGHTFEVRVEPVYDEAGEIIGSVGSGTDISERRALEERLRARERDLAELASHAPDILARFDRDLRHLFVSSAITVVTGLPAEQFVGRSFSEMGMPQELCEVWERELSEVFARAEPRRFEFDVELGASGRRWFEAHAVPELGPSGDVETVVSYTRDRTEARAALEEQLASEARYRELFELAMDMIVLFDPAGTIIDLNPSAERALGYSREELIGRRFDAIIPGPEIVGAKERLARKLDGTEPATVYEAVLLRKDGECFPAEVSTQLIDHGDGPVGVLTTGRDISEQRAARAALEESEQLFRSAFDDAAVGVMLTDPHGTLLRVNNALAEMLGYEPAELIGMTVYEITHPDDIASILPDIEAMRSGLKDKRIAEKRYLRRNGEVVWGHVGVSAVRNDDRSVQLFVAQIEDVTELRRIRQQLEESQALHRLVIESSRDLITVLDLEGTIRLISRSVETILGYTQEELVGRPFAALIHEDDLPSSGDSLREAVAGNPPIPGVGRVRAKDGSYKVLEGTASAGFGSDGTPSFVITNSRDITERSELEEQLRQSQKVEAIGKLAGGVAHDFNNLLTAINGYSDIVLAALPEAESEIRHGVEQIRRSGDRAAQLTQQLLTFSRQHVQQPEVIDVNELIADYVTMLERLVGEDIEIAARLHGGLAPVNVDPGQLGQVLVNLVVNARDAMPDGGRIEIETASSRPDKQLRQRLALKAGAYVAITISDSGEGMAPETLARAFDPFFTTKGPGKGTGLGLSTVHGIIKKSGGAITSRSEPGSGTTFCLHLPATTGTPGPVRREPNRQPPLGAGEAILVVEDSVDVRTLVERLLGSLGYTVSVAATPAEALAIVAGSDPIDLVLTDVVMPEMNGHQLATKLNELRPGLRVLYTSGYTGDALEARGVLEEKNAFIQKPFTAAALGDQIRRILDAGKTTTP
jgi:PAS domain S-box-containing protein